MATLVGASGGGFFGEERFRNASGTCAKTRAPWLENQTNYHKPASLGFGRLDQPVKVPHKSLRGATLSIFEEEVVSSHSEEERAVPVKVQLRYLLCDLFDPRAWIIPGAIGRPDLGEEPPCLLGHQRVTNQTVWGSRAI